MKSKYSMEQNMSRRAFLKRTVQLSVGAGLATTGGAGYAYKVEPEWVELKKVTLTLPRLGSGFHNYRIAQISDLHAGGWLKRDHFQDVVARVNAEAPDLIVVTGDFTGGDLYATSTILEGVLDKLRAPDGVMSVMGNHDHWEGIDGVREMLGPYPVNELRNSARTLERGGSLLSIAGVDDIWEKQNRLDLALSKVPKDGAAILLAHEPDFADEAAAAGRFDLMLSGHSHGGQVVVPFFRPPQLPYLGQKYHTGLYKVGDMLQYTNRGIGMIRPFVRFDCRPEITIFTLQSPG